MDRGWLAAANAAVDAHLDRIEVGGVLSGNSVSQAGSGRPLLGGLHQLPPPHGQVRALLQGSSAVARAVLPLRAAVLFATPVVLGVSRTHTVGAPQRLLVPQRLLCSEPAVREDARTSGGGQAAQLDGWERLPLWRCHTVLRRARDLRPHSARWERAQAVESGVRFQKRSFVLRDGHSSLAGVESNNSSSHVRAASIGRF